jgi:hypothetical protein
MVALSHDGGSSLLNPGTKVALPRSPHGAKRNAGPAFPAVAALQPGYGFAVHPRLENLREKYNRSTMENARQLQCKALRTLAKIRRRKNNGEQWKKQCAEPSKQ